MPEDAKMSRVKLIKVAFPEVGFQDMKGMSELDKSQLASAVARREKIDPSKLDFELVDY